jgi:hypothetical protein
MRLNGLNSKFTQKSATVLPIFRNNAYSLKPSLALSLDAGPRCAALRAAQSVQQHEVTLLTLARYGPARGYCSSGRILSRSAGCPVSVPARCDLDPEPLDQPTLSQAGPGTGRHLGNSATGPFRAFDVVHAD